MSISRTEVEIVVTGAGAAETGLRAVAAAEQSVARQADAASPAVNRLSQSMQDMTRAGMTYNSMTMTWERNTQKAAQAQRFASGVTREVTAGHIEAAKATGALASSLEVAGKGFTILSRAAAILPGFGIAGLLLAIGTGVKAMVDAFKGAEPTTRLQTAALAEYARVLAAAEKGVNDLAAAQTAAGRGMIGGAYGVDPGSLSGRARIQAAQLGQQKDALDAQQKRLDMEAGKLAAMDRSLMQRTEAVSGMKVTPQQAVTIRGQLIIEAENIGKRRQMYDAEAQKTQAAAIELEAKLERMRRAAGIGDKPDAKGKARGIGPGGSPSSPFGGAMFGINPAPGEDLTPFGIESARAQDAARKARDDAAFARMNADIDAARKAEAAQAAGAAAGAREFGKQAAPSALTDAMAQMGDSFTGTFDRMATGATDAAGIMVQAIGTITTALGSMMTNLIISGDAGAKGLKKMAGNALAGVSAQAFGFAVFLEAAALAAALSGPILGWSAPGLATAGAVMAGAGAALGVTARMLGADQIGAAKGGAKGGGGGGAPASAAGTNPFGGTGNQQTQVVVYIGSEVVTRGVQTETRRTALRGGITEGRMAMAS